MEFAWIEWLGPNRSPPRHEPCVYVLYFEGGKHDGLVKVGYTADAGNRFSAIRGHIRSERMFVVHQEITGHYIDVERIALRRLRPFRANGTPSRETFDIHPEHAACVVMLAAQDVCASREIPESTPAASGCRA